MRTLKFDQFLRESQREKLRIDIYGHHYEIESRIPAIVPLKMARAEKLAETDRNAEYTRLIFEAADAMFGKENMEEICSFGLSAEDLSLLIQKCFEMINGAAAEEESEELSDEDGRSSLPGRSQKK